MVDWQVRAAEFRPRLANVVCNASTCQRPIQVEDLANAVATQRLSGMPTSASGSVLSRVYMQRINSTNFLCRRRQFWVNRVGLTAYRRLPLSPRQRTSSGRPGRSVSCQKRSIDHRVGGRQQCCRKFQPERCCRLLIEHKFVFGQPVERNVAGFCAP